MGDVTPNPTGGTGKRRSILAYGPNLSLAAARGEPGWLKHLQVFGDSRLLEVERFNELVNSRLSLHEPRENRASRCIRQCGCIALRPVKSQDTRIQTAIPVLSATRPERRPLPLPLVAA